MEALLLGTGSADGWPNPWCRCASCGSEREAGRVRGSTAVLLDRVLLVDCGPDVPRAADRAGVSLADVRALLLTHAHPDHLAPEALLARSWAGASSTLRVLGPASAIDACRDWVGPHDPVSLEVLVPGDVVDLDGHVVRALAAAHDDGTDALTRDALLYDVTSPDGSRVLHACDTGPLPEATAEAVRGAAYDLVLLEETFGRTTGHGTGHLDLATFPRELARLRDVGAVTAATDVVAVHLSHHNPPTPELSRVLRPWGARVVDDLTTITLGDAVALSSVPHRRLVLGGARSGKSVEAERSLAAHPRVTYVATGGTRDGDPEWAARVRAHRDRRPASWTTTESLDVAAPLRAAAAADAVLVDCLALWLAGTLDAARVWDAEPGTAAYAETLAHVDREIDGLVDAVRGTPARVVLVSNEVGSGVVPENASGRLYRDLLGTLNTRVAAVCDEVDLVVAGRVVRI